MCGGAHLRTELDPKERGWTGPETALFHPGEPSSMPDHHLEKCHVPVTLDQDRNVVATQTTGKPLHEKFQLLCKKEKSLQAVNSTGRTSSGPWAGLSNTGARRLQWRPALLFWLQTTALCFHPYSRPAGELSPTALPRPTRHREPESPPWQWEPGPPHPRAR